MTGYTKLFSSILGSTIWGEDNSTRIVWITLLALTDRDGIAEASIPGLANFARVTIGEAEAAIKKFMAPDKYSRSPEHEGRRLEPVEGGWRILNHHKYRERMSADDIRERDRIRKQRQREQKKCPTQSGTNCDNSENSAKSNIQKHKAESIKQKQKQNANPPAAGAAAGGLCARLHVTNKNAAELQRVISLAMADWNMADETEVADRLFEAWKFHNESADRLLVPRILLPMVFMTGGTWSETDKTCASNTRVQAWMNQGKTQSAG
jgi:hypothetical protein